MKYKSNSSPQLRLLKGQQLSSILSKNPSIELHHRYQTLQNESQIQESQRIKLSKSPRLNITANYANNKPLTQRKGTFSRKKTEPRHVSQYTIPHQVIDIKQMYPKMRPSTSQQSKRRPETPKEIVTNKQYEYYISDVLVAHQRGESYMDRLIRDHFNMSFYAWRQCETHQIIYRPKTISLPLDQKVFDLDETLVHCTLDPHLPADKRLTVRLSVEETLNVGVNIRPGLQQMLDLLAMHYELVIFTASHGAYARKIIDYIDPKRVFSFILTREYCCYTNQGQYIKDLSILRNRDLSKLVLIDNAACSYFYQQENGIPIVPFYESKLDKQLSLLTKYLIGMLGCQDVRAYNRKHLKLHLMNQGKTPEEVLDLYRGSLIKY